MLEVGDVYLNIFVSTAKVNNNSQGLTIKLVPISQSFLFASLFDNYQSWIRQVIHIAYQILRINSDKSRF